MEQRCLVCKLKACDLICLDCEQQMLDCIDISMAMNVFYYKQPVSTLITRFKYNQDLLAAKVLMKYASIVLSGMWQQFDAIIPMPVNKERLIQRGVHCTDYLARLLMRFSNNPLPIVDTYDWRPVYSVPQQVLTRSARFCNIKASDFKMPVLDLDRYLVFDDVLTTGTTWQAFKCLNPDKLFLLTLARTGNELPIKSSG